MACRFASGIGFSLSAACVFTASVASAQPAEQGAPAAASPPTTAPAPATASPTVTPATPREHTEPKEEPRRAPNSIYAEGLGAGFAYSINYERLVVDDLGVRLGFSYLSFTANASAGSASASSSSTFLTFPLTASYVGIHSGKHA